MKSFHCCLKNILADKFKVPENASVENRHSVTLQDIDQELTIYDMPSHVVVVKCPPNQEWLFNQGYTQICDYLIFDSSCNAVILCELKKTLSENHRNKAFKQIMHTKKLVQYIIAGMETHCEIGEINRKIKEHYMMFSDNKGRAEKISTHGSTNKVEEYSYEDVKGFTLYSYVSSKISYSQIRETIGCKSVN